MLVSPLFAHFVEIPKAAEEEQPTSQIVSKILVPSHQATTICPLSNSLRPAIFSFIRKNMCKNDSLSYLTAVKYHSLLITSLSSHPDEFIKRCEGVHNLLARRCIDAHKRPSTVLKRGTNMKIFCEYERNEILLRYMKHSSQQSPVYL
ncbi:uncharacterized protein TNCV_4730271 [Trichonephila clavipes]|nr:uncharacterized protein TNCV_4730271 [Trichonephila clavipes]